ncbi:uncharacterized protein DDB_G0283697-like [Odontomachus brunneus]|uniref:uncharacterized protein DDB_G0283697-like n=1 Tax=Odontomachus brunneus TaxID=486640 RepID=UPI0013F27CFD|nr:uncharacterized protein DDB_G0283697-like [Odontomachus brunneus]
MEKQEFVANLHYLPIAIFVSLPTVLIITYVMAVLLGHVEAGFPYISTAATTAPESCIFSQAVNVIAVLMGFMIYIRYAQVKECTSVFRSSASLPKWNHWALIFGLLSTVGFSIVANFQETSLIVVHLIGAFLCFGGGTVYFWTQAVCSFYLHPLGYSLRLAHIRTALSTFTTVCFFVIVITGVLARLAYKGTNSRKWQKEDGGWELHITSTITEWLCAMTFCFYILTFTEEFRDIRISHPKLIGRGAGGYVNLLSHSPVDTPCPGYRYRESRDNLLDEAAPLVATTPPALRDAERSPDVLCPVQVHVHDSTARERRCPRGHRAKKKRQRAVDNQATKWIDLDENVPHGYILIDDKNLGPGVLEIDSEEVPFPEHAVEYDDENDDDDDDEDDNHGDDDDNDSRDENVGSHGRCEWSMYKQLKKNVAKRYRCDLDLGATYPLANSHGNAYQDSSSHSKYTELYSEFRAKNNPDASNHDFDVTFSYSVANSHSEHGDPTTDVRDRAYRESSESDNLVWDTGTGANYEIANSHSNYRVFYDSQTQHYASGMLPPWSSELWPENRREEDRVTSDDSKDNNAIKQDCDEHKATADQSEKKIGNEQDSNACDIEQCLVQIEESLLNIEQNLLHVQDLDIPELRNLLYKSPSIERSLFEVQDLLYADGIVPVISRKSMSLDSDEEEEEEEDEEEEEEEEVWVGQNLTIKDNDNEDGDASAPLLNSSNEESSDTVNVDEQNPSKSTDDHYVDGSNVVGEEEKNLSLQTCAEKTMNFVPNSLNKTMPRRIVLDEVKENIRLCSSESEEPTITIDYNLNSACAEKKSFCRDKWHSRTNSLDENSIFQNSELGDKQENSKSSLQDIFLESTSSRLVTNAKARSEGTLQTNQDKSLRRDRGGSQEELLQAVEATAEDFRKKLESFASQRRSMLDRQKKTNPKSIKELSDNTSRSREKSPVRQAKRATTTTTSKTQEKDNGAGKSTGCDKRKKKKTSAKSTSDNALIPSKLISLSLSLLLAALLQAVRCLTDLVEDAFRSVSYDRNGLLQ